MEDFLDVGGGEAVEADFDKCAHEIAYHAIKKAVATEAEGNEVACFFYFDEVDVAGGRRTFVAGVAGEGGEIVLADKMGASFTDSKKIEFARNVPRAVNFKGRKNGIIDDAIEILFAF